MLDRTPPGRYSVVERDGRLVVIERDSGRVPPTAAERMAEYDRRIGRVSAVPERLQPDPSVPHKAPEAAPTRAEPPNDPLRDAFARKNAGPVASAKKAPQPWSRPAEPVSRPTRSEPTPRRESAAVTADHRRKTIRTAKWWDARGPRTIELGAEGQSTLSAGFVTLALMALAVIALLLIFVPLLAFVAGFLLFRLGGTMLAPIGAAIVDRAVAAHR